nr:putative alpha/beta hydrolase fold protein [Tanacetum cinerariifolium]
LAGATLIAPVVNYWWPNFPSTLSSKEYSKQFVHDKWSLWVAHHLPSLTYWWNTRTWLPPHSVIAHSPDVLSPQDRKLVPIFTAGRAGVEEQVRQQG